MWFCCAHTNVFEKREIFFSGCKWLAAFIFTFPKLAAINCVGIVTIRMERIST